MAFTTERFLEVAIESWPKWDLKLQPLKSSKICNNSNKLYLFLSDNILYFKKVCVRNLLDTTETLVC